MFSLLIDTALQGSLVAVSKEGGEILAVRKSDALYGQAETLMPMIEEVLAEAGISYKDLEQIGTTVGPGAFTGLRVGLAAARSLCQVLNIPGIGICSFDALFKTYASEYAVRAECLYAVLIETKRQDYYVRIYEGEKAKREGTILLVEGVFELLKLEPHECIVVGDCVKRFESETGSGFSSVEIMGVSAKALADLVFEGSDKDLSPIYMRSAGVNIAQKPIL